MMEVKAEFQTGVALVAKAFHIIDMFQLDCPTWTQAELVRATGLNRSTINRLVRFLADRGYLVQVADTGRYSLGLAAIELGNRAHFSFDLRITCQPRLAALAVNINETIILSAFDPTSMMAICIDQIEGRHQGLRVFERVGTRFPLHAGAAPKAMLAFVPKDVQDACLSRKLERLTDHTVVDPHKLRLEIAESRERGYAISWEETFEGTTGLGAPILGPGGSVVGSVGVTLPLQRAKPGVLETISKFLLQCTNEINRDLAGDRA